eukprot:4758734-Prorocentrum_lima.AAC.1
MVCRLPITAFTCIMWSCNGYLASNKMEKYSWSPAWLNTCTHSSAEKSAVVEAPDAVLPAGCNVVQIVAFSQLGRLNR